MRPETCGRQNGAAIRAIRKKDRRTVADLAAHAGIQPQTLTNIENGSRPASPKVIAAIADLLGVPIEAITRDGTGRGIAAEDASDPEGVAA